MGKLSPILSLPYYQEFSLPCAAWSVLLSTFRHHVDPLGLVSCGFYKHEFEPKARYGIWTKDCLISLERTDGNCFYHHLTTEGMELEKIILEIEGVSSRATNIMMTFCTHRMFNEKVEFKCLMNGLQLFIKGGKNRSPTVTICSFAGTRFLNAIRGNCLLVVERLIKSTNG